MSTDLSKTEFLKRYLGNEKKVKRRKKSKPSNSLIPRVKIIDENIDLKSIPLGEKEIDEEEDIPVVAEVIDERPAEVKIKELYESSKWKRLDSSANDGVPDAAAQCDSWREDLKEISSPVSKNRTRHDSNSGCSPPRKFQSATSQTRHDSGSDISPPRDRPASAQVRKRRHDSGSDCSPPHKLIQQGHKHESDSDISPPRRTDSHEHKIRNKTKRNAHNQHKRHNSDSDLSPERVKSFTKRVERNSDSDLSPPRAKNASKGREDSPKKDSKRRPVKTLSGLKAGLQNAVTLRTETQDLRNRERSQINQLDAELSGRSAKTILRDRKTGKRRDLEEENREKLEKEKRLSEQQQKYAAWGKGIEQTESKKNKLSDDLYESSKPLARYQGDDDLEETLKAVIHVDDPMAEFFKKKKKKENVSTMPEYKGPPPPPNRFGIKPGYRWDGVDRSNGFERKYFEKHSNTKAVEEEAYLWSIQDM